MDRLKPRFRQFILEGCKEPHNTDAGVRSTPLRGRMAGVHDSWSVRRGQELEGARKSLALEADENGLRPASFAMDTPADEDIPPTRSHRLQEIRRRMGGLGGREPVSGGADSAGASMEATTEVTTIPAPEGSHNMERYNCTELTRLLHTLRY